MLDREALPTLLLQWRIAHPKIHPTQDSHSQQANGAHFGHLDQWWKVRIPDCSPWRLGSLATVTGRRGATAVPTGLYGFLSGTCPGAGCLPPHRLFDPQRRQGCIQSQDGCTVAKLHRVHSKCLNWKIGGQVRRGCHVVTGRRIWRYGGTGLLASVSAGLVLRFALCVCRNFPCCLVGQDCSR